MTAIRPMSLNNTAWLVFIMKHCVFYTAGTEFLNNNQRSSKLQTVKNYAMKVHGGKEVQLHMSITSALDRGKWSNSWLHCFTPGEREPGIK
jgi:hypothetical protein